MNNKPYNMNRRDFLKLLALGSAASLAALGGCDLNKQNNVDSSKSGPVPTDKMTYRTDSKTGNKISLLGYGCMRYPRLPKKEALGKDNDIDQEAVNESVDYAIAHGINYFDTSPRYCKGFSEHATGLALSRHPRSKYFIATKLSNFSDFTREGTIDMYNNSFKELQVDYIDYYLLHALGLARGGTGMEVLNKRYIDNGILDFLLKEREAGRIRNLGWSFHGDIEVFDHMLKMGIKWDFVQIQLNYIDWEYPQGMNSVKAKYLYDELTKRNISIIIMEPLLGGRLANIHYKAQKILKQAEPEASIASWAFRYAGSLPNVLTVLSGMTYLEHMQDNIRTYSPLIPLTEKERQMLERAANLMLEYQNITCTNCGYCMPCPYGINIPAVFAHYNRCLNEGNFPDNTQDPHYRKARRAFLVGLDRNVEKLRQANHCTGCGICSTKCPQNIRIPNEMGKIDRFVESLKINV
ncbi:MAG: aldo/keto reductase [Candidatus Omnitrophica bacterium]|nr:aldo/keto reductase [Candidatus Omnitrophota bacterium]